MAEEVARRGKIWVAPVWSQDFRPKDEWFVEARNSETFRLGWEHAIGSNCKLVNILTWNDYSEGSEIRPSTSIRYFFHDLTAFFAHRFKFGAAPEITNEVLFYSHRIHLVDLTKISGQRRPFRVTYGPVPTNEIEVVAFLNSTGQVVIHTGEQISAFDVPGGISSVRTPAHFGTPRFQLMRNGVSIIEFVSQFEILESAEYQDMLYHGGSSARVA